MRLNLSDFSLQLPEPDDLAPLSEPVHLRRVPLPLTSTFRYQWRLLMVLLSLQASRTGTASIEQLHTLVWAMSDPRNAERLGLVWNRTSSTNAQRLRGYVPGLIDTLRVAHAEDLVTQTSSGREQLSAAGANFLNSYSSAGGQVRPHQQMVIDLGPFTAAGMWRRLGGEN